LGKNLPLYLLTLQIVVGLSVGWAMEEKMGLELEWVFNTSAQFPGLSFGAGHMGPPTVWDLDGDGVNEVLWGTRRGHSKRLWCIEGHGIFKWTYPPIEEDALPGDPTTKVSIIDVNGDGTYEMVLAGRGARLHVLNPDGSIMWTWDEPNRQNMHGAPQALDVDEDGNVEFFLNTNDGFIHRVSHAGGLVWTSDQSGSGNQGHPTIVDIDRNGKYEVLFASQDFNIYCLHAETGKQKWRFDMGGNAHNCQVYVYDVNGDGEYEIISWTDAPASCVFIVSFYGTEIARWTHPREGVNIRMGQAMGDLDGDGSMDMAIMSGDAVFGIDIGKNPPVTKWEVNFSQWSVDGFLTEGAQPNHWSSYQLIADIDGDDEQEVLWLTPYPIVTDAATGNLEGYYVNEYIARNRRQESGGWWGDVDGDGTSEWVCELNGNSHPETMLYCLSMDGKFPTEAYWPEYYHCAYPAEYQAQQDWLLLKASYSNSGHFPTEINVLEGSLFLFAFTALLTLLRGVGSWEKARS